MTDSNDRMTDGPCCCWCRLRPKDLPAGAHSGIVGTALFCSFQRSHDGSWRKMRNFFILMVIGLSYSEELNYSDESYRYRPSFGLRASGDSHLGALWRLWPSKGVSYGQLGTFRGALDTLDNPRPRPADNFWCFRNLNLGLPTSGFGERDPFFGPRSG